MSYVDEVMARFTAYRKRETEKLEEQDEALRQVIERNARYADEVQSQMAEVFAKLQWKK
jgi:hypothetical protein